METKHKPATSLPWNRTAHFVDARTSQGKLRGEKNGGVFHSVATCHGQRGTEHAAYIVHAANAYPQLVAALRVLQARIDGCELGPVNGGRDVADTLAEECAASRALLRSLGEME